MTSSISSMEGGGDTSGTARLSCDYIGAIVAGAGALADWCWYGVSSAGVAYVCQRTTKYRQELSLRQSHSVQFFKQATFAAP